jgi:hypothetical protein
MGFNIKNLVLGIAIFILTISVGIYGISTLYGKAPQYDDYCPYDLSTESSCITQGGTWMNNTAQQIIEAGSVKTIPAQGGYCNYDYRKCNDKLETALKPFHRKVFFTALPLGVAIIAVGALIFGLESVGAGLMFGGIGIILYGVGGFWRFTEDWLKFLLSLIGLIVIIWLAYYWNMRLERKGKRK